MTYIMRDMRRRDRARVVGNGYIYRAAGAILQAIALTLFALGLVIVTLLWAGF